MYELLIANKETGEIWDVASITTSEVSVSTERSGSPAQLSFSLYLTPGVRFSHGDIVRFSVNGRLIFYGFIFTIEHGRWNACTGELKGEGEEGRRGRTEEGQVTKPEG